MFKKSGAKTSRSSADRRVLRAGGELKTDGRKGRETVLSERSQPFLFSKLLVTAGVSLCVLEPENTLWWIIHTRGCCHAFVRPYISGQSILSPCNTFIPMSTWGSLSQSMSVGMTMTAIDWLVWQWQLLIDCSDNDSHWLIWQWQPFTDLTMTAIDWAIWQWQLLIDLTRTATDLTVTAVDWFDNDCYSFDNDSY